MPERLVQPTVIGQRARQLQGRPQRGQHALGRERLLEELKRAELGRPHRVGEARLAAHHHHRHVRCEALELLQRREPVRPAGHHEVEQHGVGRAALDRGERGAAVRRLRRLESLGLEQGAYHLADVGLVVDQQDARAHVAESTMEKVAPPPGVSVTMIVPWCASIVCRTSASPSPVPSCLVVK